MIRHALTLAFLGAFARDPGGCGVDSASNGVNAPCTRDKDCNAGLVCAGGVCTDPDASTAAPSDAGVDAPFDAAAARDD